MIPINEEYLHQVLPLLEIGEGAKVKQVSTHAGIGYSFPCPFCAAHQTKDSKKRKHCAFLLPHKRSFSWTFFCHRKQDHKCSGGGISFAKFLEKFNLSLYKRYQMDKYKQGQSGKGHIVSDPDFRTYLKRPFD